MTATFDANGNILFSGGTVQRTNLCLWSEAVNTSPWTSFNVALTADQTVDPNNGSTADKIADNATNGRHTVTQTIQGAAAGIYTASVYVKNGTRRYAQVALGTMVNGYGVIVDLTTGLVTNTTTAGTAAGSNSVTSVGNGWYRVALTWTADSSFQVLFVACSSLAVPVYDGNSNPTYVGDGSYIFVWGAQYETGTTATAYIPTTSSAVTQSSGGLSGQITKGTSPAQVPATALGTAYVQPGYTGVAPPPPPPWVNPVANADSLSGGVVGQARVIAASTLLANDTVDSRSSLSISTVQSAIGCTVSLNVSTQNITMTPTQTSPVSFTYTVTDTQSNTANALVTFPSVSPAVVVGQPPVPDLSPGLDATNSTLLQINNTGIDQTFTLTAGVDYRVQFMAAITGRIWLVGGRKVHVGWGPTPTDYGGQITSTGDGVTCLIVEGMSGSCWIEGMVCLKNATHGHCFQIRAAANAFPVTIINCFASGALPVNTGGGGSALTVHDGICPKITVDGFTFVTFGQGIASAPSTGGSFTELVCNHVYGHWGVNASRLIGQLIEVPAIASFADTWVVDDANPSAAISPLVTGVVTPTVATGDDWTLPSWVTTTTNSGYVHFTTANVSLYGPKFSNVILRWSDVEPTEGTFNWTALSNAINDSTTSGVLLRIWGSDSTHLPTWLKNKYPSITGIPWRWGSVPWNDLLGGSAPGNFYPIWRSELETEWRAVMNNLAASGLAANAKVKVFYAPHGWYWDEFSVKYTPEAIAAGFTPTTYLAWFQRTLQDYKTACGGQAGKVVYTGTGASEFIENNPTGWHPVINPVNFSNGLGHSALSRYARLNGFGTRDGFTEQFNGYPDMAEWGSELQTIGSYRYSVANDANEFRQAGAIAGKYFGTESEDYNTSYFNSKMIVLNRLRLLMNWDIPNEGTRAAGTDVIFTWAKLEMGKQVTTAPDAWCCLRMYKRAPIRQFYSTGTGETSDQTVNIRNFERWITQREVSPDGLTTETELTTYDANLASNNGPNGYEALRTRGTTGVPGYMYFYIDNAFHSGATSVVLDIKVTYKDLNTGPWTLEYKSQSSALASSQPVTRANDSQWKTATFRISDGVFDGSLTSAADFRLNDQGSALTVQFVRVVKVTGP